MAAVETIVLATHDAEVAWAAQRIVRMLDGRSPRKRSTAAPERGRSLLLKCLLTMSQPAEGLAWYGSGAMLLLIGLAATQPGPSWSGLVGGIAMASMTAARRT